MGKVFTITEGLENMGALKTGGQGSVYKGRRIGEIITAVKLLPTPIHSESDEDKNFIGFQNEVEKLKKVNETPNPNVVKILSSGITDTGAFPFIEMEFIEGPDLEELLKEPNDPVFSLKEVIKVAEQLSSALAHCHGLEVKHGDIKTNNVKLNVHTGNYVLLDFGLAIMSDEQRRTSLRHAGAIEFMAPEQNEGKMLFQTDVYSFGVVLYELLGGRVPFPLEDSGETSRNTVMVSHMETPPPDVLALRQQNIPQSWMAEKQEHEMLVPEWLTSTLYKCLEKDPEARFTNGVELHEYIVLNSTLAAKKAETDASVAAVLQADHDRLLAEKDQLQNTLLQYQQEIEKKNRHIETLKAAIAEKNSEILTFQNQAPVSNARTSRQGGVSRGAFMALLLLTLGFGAVAAYSLFKNQRANQLSSDTVTTAQTDTSTQDGYAETTATTEASTVVKDEPIKTTQPTEEVLQQEEPEKKTQTEEATITNEEIKEQEQKRDENDEAPKTAGAKYTVINKAYFHNEPDESTRRAAFIVHWNKAVLQPQEEKNGFVYVVFTNHLGQTSKGWLRKQDLKQVEE